MAITSYDFFPELKKLIRNLPDNARKIVITLTPSDAVMIEAEIYATDIISKKPIVNDDEIETITKKYFMIEIPDESNKV